MALAILEPDPREEFEKGLAELKSAEANQSEVVAYLRSQGMIVLPYESRAPETGDIDSICDVLEPGDGVTRSGVIVLNTVKRPDKVELLATGCIPSTDISVKLYVDTTDVRATSMYGDTVKAYAGRAVRTVPHVSLFGQIGDDMYSQNWPVGEKDRYAMPVVPQKSRLPLEAMF